jgi:hypothetical protein
VREIEPSLGCLILEAGAWCFDFDTGAAPVRLDTPAMLAACADHRPLLPDVDLSTVLEDAVDLECHIRLDTVRCHDRVIYDGAHVVDTLEPLHQAYDVVGCVAVCEQGADEIRIEARDRNRIFFME